MVALAKSITYLYVTAEMSGDINIDGIADDHLKRKLLSQTIDFCEFVYLTLTL
jgi:hypothetical protein